MEKKKNLFKPMITSVILTILIYFFSLLFIEFFDTLINYIIIGIIYIYLYINLYKIFNNNYFSCIENYFNILSKLKLVNVKLKNNNKLKGKYICIYMLLNFSFIPLLLVIWQMVLGIKFISVTNLVCVITFILMLIISIILLREINNKKKKSK